MKVCIAGANSFLGKALVKELVDFDILELSRSSSPSLDLLALASNTQEYRELLSKRLKEFSPDIIVMLAWMGSDKSGRESEDLQQSNVQAIKNFTQVVQEVLPQCRFMGIGSQAEVGICQGDIVVSSPCQPITPYGRAKLEAGKNILAQFNTLGSWIRILTLYGEGDRPEKLIPLLLKAYKSGKTIETTGGDQLWDFLHVQDAARAIVLAIKNPEFHGLHILASGEAVLLKDLIQKLYAMCRERGYPAISPAIGARPYTAHELFRLTAQSDEFLRATGWRPEISLQQGLARLLTSDLA